MPGKRSAEENAALIEEHVGHLGQQPVDGEPDMIQGVVFKDDAFKGAWRYFERVESNGAGRLQ